MSGRAVDRHATLPEPNPRPEASEKTLPLRRFTEKINDPPREKRAVARIQGHLHLGHSLQQPIEHEVGQPQEDSLTSARSLRKDHVIALGIPLQERRYEFWRVLEIAVKNNRYISGYKIQGSGERSLVPEVA